MFDELHITDPDQYQLPSAFYNVHSVWNSYSRTIYWPTGYWRGSADKDAATGLENGCISASGDLQICTFATYMIIVFLLVSIHSSLAGQLHPYDIRSASTAAPPVLCEHP
jgi:hypothetical protein